MRHAPLPMCLLEHVRAAYAIMQGAANAPDLGQLSGAPLAQALGAKVGSSDGRSGASKWLRADYSATPVQPEVSNVINVG